MTIATRRPALLSTLLPAPLLAAALILGPLSGPVPAQEGGSTAGQVPSPAIEGTIRDQLNAFRADDFETAFGFASPGIRSMFGTSENFGAMVRQGYPMVYRPGEVRFLDLREVAGELRQKVMIRDASGAIHLLDYEMVEGPDGWRIDGVQLLQADAVGA